MEKRAKFNFVTLISQFCLRNACLSHQRFTFCIASDMQKRSQRVYRV